MKKKVSTLKKKKRLDNFNADSNNQNDGTSGFNKIYLARIANENKMRDKNYIRKLQLEGKIPSKNK